MRSASTWLFRWFAPLAAGALVMAGCSGPPNNPGSSTSPAPTAANTTEKPAEPKKTEDTPGEFNMVPAIPVAPPSRPAPPEPLPSVTPDVPAETKKPEATPPKDTAKPADRIKMPDLPKPADTSKPVAPKASDAPKTDAPKSDNSKTDKTDTTDKGVDLVPKAPKKAE
jgi:ribonuclease E